MCFGLYSILDNFGVLSFYNKCVFFSRETTHFMPLPPFLALNEGSGCAYHAGRLNIHSPFPGLPLFTAGQPHDIHFFDSLTCHLKTGRNLEIARSLASTDIK